MSKSSLLQEGSICRPAVKDKDKLPAMSPQHGLLFSNHILMVG